jgi:excisionase family DNA binding protein
MTNSISTPWLNTLEAAAYLRAKAGTLKNWRHRGEGPRYHIINGRLIRYHQSELDAYVMAQDGKSAA